MRVLLQERGVGPGLAFTWFCCDTHRAGLSFQRLWAPQLPLTSPGRGDPSSSPAQAHAPVLFPTAVPPSVAEHQFPSLLAQGTPPSQPKESCTNHLHCRAAAHWGHKKPQQWGQLPPPSSTKTPRGFPPLPTQRCHQPQGPADKAATANSSCTLQQGSGVRDRASASPHKTLSYWVVGTGAAEQEGQGMSHRVLGFCPHGRRNHRANTPGVRARGTCKTPALAQMTPRPPETPPEGPEVLQGEAPLWQSVLQARAAPSRTSPCAHPEIVPLQGQETFPLLSPTGVPPLRSWRTPPARSRVNRS